MCYCWNKGKLRRALERRVRRGDESTSSAIFSERGLGDVPMGSQKAGEEGNVRMFNRVDFQRGSNIQLCQETGHVTLAPGTYRISVSSTVALKDSTDSLDPDAVRHLKYLGYCILYVNGENYTQGTFNDGCKSYPSELVAQVTVPAGGDPADVYVLQQNGAAAVNVLYTQTMEGQSANHVFARMVIDQV